MNIAVTGANGHVGTNLCRALLHQGHQVSALTHRHSRSIHDLPLRIIAGDLLKKETLYPLVEGNEICFHLAAVISIHGDPDGMVWKINTEGTRNLVEVALETGVKRFIHFSSIHAFNQQPTDQLLDETRPLVGFDGFAYDRSKATGELIVKEASSKGLDALILSPTAILGPADPEPSLAGKALLELYHRQIPALVPGGYNWVDVRDIVDTAIRAITLGRTGETYLLSGEWLSLLDLARLIEQVTGKQTIRRVMPLWVAKTGLPFITLYSRLSGVTPLYTKESLHIISEGNRYITNEKARNELHFNPRGLEETIRDSFLWFRSNGYIAQMI